MWRGCITRSLSYVDLPISLSRWEQMDEPNKHYYQYNFFEMPESSTSQPHELDYSIIPYIYLSNLNFTFCWWYSNSQFGTPQKEESDS